jgi:hypothetical protein
LAGAILKIYFAKPQPAFYSQSKGKIIMPKAKKSESEKATKAKPAKAVKSPKAEKAAPEKKAKKKAKAEPVAPVEPAAPVVAVDIEPVVKIVKAVKKAVVPKLPKVATEIVLSIEEISLRAYFIAERRQAMGWEGSSEQDWIEAERQLKAEAKKKKK